VVLPAPMEK